ncbi:SDR family oxidoreductase [Rhodoferax mekongensis]|uniref:SDR family oxidoreductase n=1 Tax=Rhodoferax mekongensis TaxID=3068341 RepID=UPI0028BED7D7|nr:SDR family oxidoreductase [Rhodoferax sp. TBRC 17199]MDT7516196.1 SDR family oxidoreductase [Rhodoferax sp. TBRC 17199]
MSTVRPSAAATRPCAFITGAGAGIGRAVALRFAQQGWQVGAGDVDQAGLHALRAEVGDSNVRTYVLDVTQTDQWREALADFHRYTCRLDLLVNNAGILISGPLQDNPLQRHHALIDVNVKGLLNGCYLAYPYLKNSPGARVINMSSSSAIYGQAGLATYSASKFAVRGLTEALNIEWHGSGVRVMDVMPLFVETAMVQDMNARSVERLGVHLTPNDVAHVVWKAAHFQGSFSRVHWSVGWMATVLFRLTSLSPQWLNHWVVRRIAA